PLGDALGRVPQLDLLAHAIEERRRDHRVPRAGILVGDGADVRVHAEDLLDQQHAPARLSGGQGVVRVERVPVRRAQLDPLAHRYFSTVTPFQNATYPLMFAAAGFGSG